MPALLLNSLGVVCPSCDFLNVVGALKCTSCSFATDGSAPPPKSAPNGVPVADAHVPPGLKRASTPVGPELSGPVSPSGKQQVAPSTGPARPTFQSSNQPAQVPAPAAAAPAAVVPGPKFGLSVLAGPARGQRFRLGATGAVLGRAKGAILFPDDPFISPTHATFSIVDGKLTVRDESSTSGIFVSVNGQEAIAANTYFCTGLRLFRYLGPLASSPPVVPGKTTSYGAPIPPAQTHYAVEEILLGNRPGRAVITAGPIFTIGQSKCDLSFGSDEGLAPRHCELSPTPTNATLRDLSGGLGTYVRVNGERALKAGDRLRVGQQTLQVEAL